MTELELHRSVTLTDRNGVQEIPDIKFDYIAIHSHLFLNLPPSELKLIC